MENQVILGLDIGATNTRVLLTDRYGKYISYYKSQDNRDCKSVHNTIENFILKTKLSFKDVISVGAGIAGIPYRDDIKDDLTLDEGEVIVSHPDLNCVKTIKNDALVAHKAAFPMGYGIVVIAGSGSSIYGVSKKGEIPLKSLGIGANNINYYVRTNRIIFSVVNHNKQTISEFVTYAAELNDKEAKKICDGVAHCIINEIKGVASTAFDFNTVPVALVGSVVNAKYIKNKVVTSFAGSNIAILEVEPISAIGAILIAMESIGMKIDKRIIDNLRESSHICQLK